jgi:hypothetical protein
MITATGTLVSFVFVASGSMDGVSVDRIRLRAEMPLDQLLREGLVRNLSYQLDLNYSPDAQANTVDVTGLVVVTLANAQDITQIEVWLEQALKQIKGLRLTGLDVTTV